MSDEQVVAPASDPLPWYLVETDERGNHVAFHVLDDPTVQVPAGAHRITPETYRAWLEAGAEAFKVADGAVVERVLTDDEKAARHRVESEAVARATLINLDRDIPRGLEDDWSLREQTTEFSTKNLPEALREKLEAKRAARATMREILDSAAQE